MNLTLPADTNLSLNVSESKHLDLIGVHIVCSPKPLHPRCLVHGPSPHLVVMVSTTWSGAVPLNSR